MLIVQGLYKRKMGKLHDPSDDGTVSEAGSSSSEPEELSSTTVGLYGSVLGVGVTLLSSESVGTPQKSKAGSQYSEKTMSLIRGKP